MTHRIEHWEGKTDVKKGKDADIARLVAEETGVEVTAKQVKSQTEYLKKKFKACFALLNRTGYGLTDGEPTGGVSGGFMFYWLAFP